MDWNIWGPPIMVMVLALTSGVFFAMFAKGTARDPEEERAELKARKKQLIEQLRELEADGSKMDSALYESRKNALVDQAAEVLRQLEQESLPVKDTESSASQKTKLSTMIIIPISLLFFVVLGGLLYHNAAPRAEGQVMTGGQGSGPMPQAALQRQERLEKAQQTLKNSPEDLNSLNVLTYDALMNRNVKKAMGYMDKARKIAPQNIDVLVHLGILQMSVGMHDKALLSINQALQKDPERGRGLLWRSLIYTNMGKKKDALADAQKAQGKLKLIEEKYFLTSILNSLNKPPPVISGSIQAPEGAKSPSGAILFVIARRAKEGGGPPVAVRRYQSRGFPKSFELGKGDMVMGGEWPEQVWLEARLDMDGNAMTKEPTDWESGRLGPYKGKITDIKIPLQAGKEAFKKPEEPTPEKSEEPNASKEQQKKVTGEAMISGAIRLQKGQKAPSKGILFIIARRSAAGGGPPAAVKRVVSPQFPVEFSLGRKNMMLGGEWPEQVWLEARLDMDGNAMTKGEDDLRSEKVGPKRKGEKGIEVVLKVGK